MSPLLCGTFPAKEVVPMKTNETIKWQEEQALQRYQLIAPLLDESLDNAKRIQMHNGS